MQLRRQHTGWVSSFVLLPCTVTLSSLLPCAVNFVTGQRWKFCLQCN